MIDEAGEGIFVANSITKTLAQPGYRGGVYHFFDNIGPVLSALPAFLAENKYQDVSNAGMTAFQKAFSTDLPAFMWLPTQPERFGPLQQVMTVNGAAGAPWFTVFPFEKAIGTFRDQVVLVDVGGGFGHQCVALLAAFPHLHGKLVLQELPQTLAQLPTQLDGIKFVEHDFFQSQPVKNARFYYLRGIMHDWPDDKCIVILKNLISAMGTDSQILIDEMVLPNVGVPWEAATIDLTMMASLGSRERTQQEWHDLLDAAGLRTMNVYTYVPRRQDSIIQAVPK
ncbi:S-adenosyl-L-methionine-dependent methyltransferase [Hypoxylon sp. EC38]|nr:S-adenosyl-L-methionine-dependent methyltransferase [Hypoxylon sp. EC38]